MNPAFLASREIGNNLSSAFTKVKDENAIESILAQAMESGDPQVLQNSIGQILSQVSPERQAVAVQYLQNAYNNVQKKQEQSRVEEQQRSAAKQGGFTFGAPPQVQAQQVRNQLPPKPVGGISAQPTPDKISNSIESVLQSNKNASADDLALAFDKAHVPMSFSKSYVENRRRKDEAKKPGDEFASIREKSIAEYVNNSLASGEEAENLKLSLDEVKKAIQGDVAGPGVTALAKNNPYTQILIGLTPDEAALQSANKKLLEGTKSIFGSKPTEREIFLLLNSMLPSIGKSLEANLAGLNFIERINDMKLMHADIISDLTDGGTKYVSDLERQVNAQMRPYGESLRKDLSKAVDALNDEEKTKDKKASNGKSGEIKVKAPDGSVGFMTQENIDKAKAQNVIFTPVK